jgi:hypothetical protein
LAEIGVILLPGGGYVNLRPIADIGAIRARYPGLKILVVSAYDDDVYVVEIPHPRVTGLA